MYLCDGPLKPNQEPHPFASLGLSLVRDTVASHVGGKNCCAVEN